MATSSYDVYMVSTPKEGDGDDEKDPVEDEPPDTTKKDSSMMIRVCHSRSCFLSCMYIHDNFMTESR